MVSTEPLAVRTAAGDETFPSEAETTAAAIEPVPQAESFILDAALVGTDVNLFGISDSDEIRVRPRRLKVIVVARLPPKLYDVRSLKVFHEKDDVGNTTVSETDIVDAIFQLKWEVQPNVSRITHTHLDIGADNL